MGEKNMSENKYSKPPLEVLKGQLTELQYQVTQLGETEHPFKNRYWNHFEKGLYVDIISGEPLFSSKDKFESTCGWPSFSRPVFKEAIRYLEDKTLHMHRIEVRSQVSDSHLGHVFDDGPEALGGMRYCINSASLKFIPNDKLDEEGYGAYKIE